MISSYASNAVLAKARSMYGKRLTPDNYSELLECGSVKEVALYLKNKTNYSELLVNLNENDIHRGQLEILLKKRILNDFAKLGRYEVSVNEGLAFYIISRMEIEELMHCLMLYSARKSDKYVLSVPMFFNNRTRIDLKALTRVKDYDDLLSALRQSSYYKILKPFAPQSGDDELNLTMIETALYTYLFRNTFKSVEKYKKKTRKELASILRTLIDLNNFVRVMRLKKYYKADNDYVKKSLLPYGSITDKQIDCMVEANSENELIEIVEKFSFWKSSINMDYDYIDELQTKVKFNKCKHFIRYSVNPPVVMFAYILLTEIELANIINIIEGIRYSLPSDEIRKMLTC